jgi:hypothetical protein
VTSRFDETGAASPAPTLLTVCPDGERLVVRTSEYYATRRRLGFRVCSCVCAVAGLGLAFAVPWAAALTAVGLAGLFAAPKLFRPAALLECDAPKDRLAVLQRTARGTTVRPSQVEAIRGEYEVYGWDPRSAVYAVLGGGERVLLLVFSGTNEALAREACRVVGSMTRRPSTYAGPFGGLEICYEPVPSELPSA